MIRKTIIAAALAAASFSASSADYYIVTGLPGKTVKNSAIQVSLATSKLNEAKVGEAYSYDFKSNLQVSGDPTFTGYGVKWSLAQGALPSGVGIGRDTGIISGTPAVAGSFDVTVEATYKDKPARQQYTLAVRPAGDVAQMGAYRAWRDGTFASSCKPTASRPRKFMLVTSGTASIEFRWPA